jgi:hypothetical protein
MSIEDKAECPKCGAKTGEPCVDRAGLPAWRVHNERTAAAYPDAPSRDR